MSRTLVVTSLVALALGACSAPPAADPMAGMRQPTEQHKQLLQGVGTWEGKLTMYMPGLPDQTVPAKEVVEAIGGFWTQSKFTCDFMGMPFLGSGCMGYDPRSGHYVGTWVDNFTDELAVMTGEMDSTGKTLIMRWTSHDPMTGEPMQQRDETTFTADSYTATFFHGAGAGTKAMVIEMKRKSGK